MAVSEVREATDWTPLEEFPTLDRSPGLTALRQLTHLSLGRMCGTPLSLERRHYNQEEVPDQMSLHRLKIVSS
jgi:hypothetical protein